MSAVFAFRCIKSEDRVTDQIGHLEGSDDVVDEGKSSETPHGDLANEPDHDIVITTIVGTGYGRGFSGNFRRVKNVSFGWKMKVSRNGKSFYDQFRCHFLPKLWW